MDSEIYKTDGSSQGKVKLPKHIFGVEPSEHAVYLTAKAQMANSRQGTAASRPRSLVRGGGKKPWRQKGRGVARAGSIRSPLWVGGGRAFGPQPRDYGLKVTKKIKALARVSVYSDKARKGQITVVEDFKLENAKTAEMYGILKALGAHQDKTLLLLAEYDADVVRAGRNIPNLKIRVATTESTYDLLDCTRLLVQRGAIDKIAGVNKG